GKSIESSGVAWVEIATPREKHAGVAMTMGVAQRVNSRGPGYGWRLKPRLHPSEGVLPYEAPHLPRAFGGVRGAPNAP
ncbi:MAG TPA: hypothetical protein VHO48_04700, partial [Anaerolineaceae bacterium]|nr:hypothetical protein [Anaerolineaceae bacterium]